jgi:hypothetical protein
MSTFNIIYATRIRRQIFKPTNYTNYTNYGEVDLIQPHPYPLSKGRGGLFHGRRVFTRKLKRDFKNHEVKTVFILILGNGVKREVSDEVQDSNSM